ncbi:hypothetical protein EA187_11830 [Lujinxingia sediminis]|uniref:IGFBP N-terminal domain-containing protein n=1 Tax=Lujinxingia sediminis TaxID=2480984 RepID=A0ABY0CRS2_9DELT|nr:hypothetical protein [Lujinxingia sediminis]RVU43512.1 hypothetical protein EA187_11830 [Lujinxingia sediminis]
MMMNWIRQGVVGAAFALVALTGCSDAADDANVGQLSQASVTCAATSCQSPTPYFNQALCACAPCALDAHCPGGATCDAAGQCVATLECETVSDCAAAEVCQAGVCREATGSDGEQYAGEPDPPTCDPDDPGACGVGQVCNPQTLQCETSITTCDEVPCHPELTCGAAGLCEGCTDGFDERCPGSFCFGGLCLQL